MSLYRVVISAFAFILLVPPALPQAPAGQSRPSSSDDQPVDTLRLDVNVVNLYFNVKDKRGALIPNLSRTDFQVLEDGSPQTIKYFSAETNQPLTLGIMVDTSASQQRVLPMEQETSAEFLREVIREKDLAFIVSFDVDIDLVHDFTSSPAQLAKALDKLKINAGTGGGGLPGLGGGPVPVSRPRGTLLYDAIFAASREQLAHEVGRKALIIFTDGEDQGSQETIRNAIEAAQKADAICYVILIADRGFYGGMGYGGDRAMRQLTEQTGGRMIEVGNNRTKLQEAFSQISAELRSQYSIGYTPTNNRRDGSFRRVEVRPVNKDLRVQNRSGYYAPLPQQSD